MILAPPSPRFVAILSEWGVVNVTGDRYAGLTFQADFQSRGIGYRVSDKSKSQLFEALEPWLNGRRVVLPDLAILEQQLLGLAWRGGKIDHSNGEHDDWANAVAGICVQLLGGRAPGDYGITLGSGADDPASERNPHDQPIVWTRCGVPISPEEVGLPSLISPSAKHAAALAARRAIQRAESDKAEKAVRVRWGERSEYG